MNFTYRFPAVKGMQARKEYYVSMVPMKLLPKIFLTESDTLPPEYRAQRKINELRIPEIKEYILKNRNSYVFSALSASINGEYKFYPSEYNPEIGVLEVNMDSTFLINDGQHRKAAIESAMQEDESIGEETISIVFFKDDGLKRSQQMFTDLNKHAVKTSNSLSTLYDSRDQLAVATKKVIENVIFFRMFTDKERDILGKNSSNLFTLNMFYKANKRIIHKEDLNSEDLNFLISYWNTVSDNIMEWQEVINKSLTKKALRENYIITFAITINAFGRLGNYFYENKSLKMEDYLARLNNIDWLRSNPCWIGRTIRENGKVLNSEEAVILTYLFIKQQLNLPLSKEEISKENAFLERG